MTSRSPTAVRHRSTAAGTPRLADAAPGLPAATGDLRLPAVTAPAEPPRATVEPGPPQDVALVRPRHKIVVLDDDPTGSQTVHGCPLLLRWDRGTLLTGLRHPSPLLFLLANTRALDPAAARERVTQICRALAPALREAEALGWIAGWQLVSRGDSTLRGHYPLEVDVLAAELGPFDATLLAPAFLEGGRTTRGAVHRLHGRPVHETPFARDGLFGYRHSDLRAWVEEKSGGRIPATAVQHLSVSDLEGDPGALRQRLASLHDNATVVVDAERSEHLQALAAALRDFQDPPAHGAGAPAPPPASPDLIALPTVPSAAAMEPPAPFPDAGLPVPPEIGLPPDPPLWPSSTPAAAAATAAPYRRRFLVQSAAGLIGALAALEPQPLDATGLAGLRRRDARGRPLPGLVLVGSHVPLADQQLERLLAEPRCQGLELPVDRLQRVLEGPLPDRLLASLEAEWGARLEALLASGTTPVLFTSRGERRCRHAAERRALGLALAGLMARLAASLAPRLGYLISKGGITTHTLLADGLGLASVELQGQLLPGLSLVLAGPEALPLLTFPGNLGMADTLREAWSRMEDASPPATPAP